MCVCWLPSKVLGEKYAIFSHELGPSTLGWRVERPRLIAVMLHRTKVAVRTHARPWGYPFEDLCRRQCRATWGMFFTAGDAELNSEEEWARSRPQSIANVGLPSQVPHKDKLKELAAHSRFTSALTPAELDRLRIYMDMHGDGLFMLSQNPAEHGQFATPQENMNTLIANSGIVFSTLHWRWP